MDNEKFKKIINTENKKQLLKILLTDQGDSRVEIAKTIGVSSASISKISESLINSNLIEEEGSIDDGKIGRKQIKLKIKEGEFYAVGIEIHLNYISIIVTDLSLKILYEKSLDFDTLDQNHINILANELIQIKRSYDKDKILGWGLLIQGVITENESMSLPVKGICSQIIRKVGIKPIVVNNIKGLAIAENFARVNNDNYLFVRYGPGIGGVLSIDGNVINGLRNRAGEIGHVKYNDNSKIKCPICKQYGCLESEINLNRIYREKYGSYIKSHDQISEKFISENFDELISYVKILSKSISRSIDLIDPDYILLAGKIFENEKIFECLISEINSTKEIDYTDRIKKIINYKEKVKYAPIISVLDYYLS